MEERAEQFRSAPRGLTTVRKAIAGGAGDGFLSSP